MENNFNHYTTVLSPFKFSDTSTPLSNVHLSVGKADDGGALVYFGEMQEGTKDVFSGRGI